MHWQIANLYDLLTSSCQSQACNLRNEICIGRYTNENRRNRLCTRCTLNDIEDEYHFLLVCPFNSNIREKYIKKFYYQRHSVFKVIKLLSVNNVKELCNLGKYIYLALKKRDTI